MITALEATRGGDNFSISPPSSGQRLRPGLDAHPPAPERDRRAPIAAAEDREVLGKGNPPDADHRECQDGQESKHSAANQQRTEGNPPQPTPPERNALFAETQFRRARCSSLGGDGWPTETVVPMVGSRVGGKRLSRAIRFPAPLQARHAFAIGLRARRNVPIPGSSVGRASGC